MLAGTIYDIKALLAEGLLEKVLQISDDLSLAVLRHRSALILHVFSNVPVTFIFF